jgi:hypothetical protein
MQLKNMMTSFDVQSFTNCTITLEEDKLTDFARQQYFAKHEENRYQY